MFDRRLPYVFLLIFVVGFTQRSQGETCPGGYELSLTSRVEEIRAQCVGAPGFSFTSIGAKVSESEKATDPPRAPKSCVKCVCASSPTHSSCMTLALGFKAGVNTAGKTASNLAAKTGEGALGVGKSVYNFVGKIWTAEEEMQLDDPTDENTKNTLGKRAKGDQDPPLPVARPADEGTTQPKVNVIPDSTGDEAADLQLCQQAQAKASQCCGNPLACLNDAVNQGYLSASEAARVSQSSTQGYAYNPNASLKETCRNMQSASSDNSSANQALGGYCYQLKSSCQSTCMAMRNQHPASSSFDSSISTCQSLTARSAATGAASLNSQQSAALMARCQSLTGAETASQEGGGQGGMFSGLGSMFSQNDDSGSDSNNPAQATQESCESNPDSESCRALKAITEARGQGQFVDASKQSNPNFNVNDNQVTPQTQFADPSQSSQAATFATVPNNTGGGLPGDQNQPQARPGGNSARPTAAAGGGYNTDIMRGDRSGGGYSQPVSLAAQDFESTERRANPRHVASTATARDLNYLKSFLPGGSRDPKFNQRPADPMALQRQQLGIYGPEVNIFEKVSQAYIRVCKEGRLFDCIDHTPTPEQCTAEHNRIKLLIQGK